MTTLRGFQSDLNLPQRASLPDVDTHLNQESIMKLDSSAPASPPDVDTLLNQESIIKLTPSAPASPPDVDTLLNQESIIKLTPSAPASPPDVRRGYASPFNSDCEWAKPLVRALPQRFMAQGRTRGSAQASINVN